jgi:indolepyruvate ferredoxin oxidoreductase
MAAGRDLPSPLRADAGAAGAGDDPGVTAVIYDQTCAAEKRRRRKRGTYPDPDKRVIINELVCEGCGDCGKKSNCVSVQPLETEYGRKRRIDQSNCNKDFSCLDGLLPVVRHHRGRAAEEGRAGRGRPIPTVPEPEFRDLDHDPWACIVTGVGGTGVVTVGAILGMAAHLEGRGCGMIDMAGLAQKGGAVFQPYPAGAQPGGHPRHPRRGRGGRPDPRLRSGRFRHRRRCWARCGRGETVAVVNTAEVASGEFTRKPDYQLPAERLKRSIREAAGEGCQADFVDATAIAARLFGNTLAANMFMLGYAYQKGAVPLIGAALEKAIELNGEAVAMNLAAFRWGRVALHDMAAIRALIEEAIPPTRQERF